MTQPYLDIRTSPHELNASQRAGGNEAGTASGLGAPGDGLSFGVANKRVWLRGSPQAEVWGSCQLQLLASPGI